MHPSEKLIFSLSLPPNGQLIRYSTEALHEALWAFCLSRLTFPCMTLACLTRFQQTGSMLSSQNKHVVMALAHGIQTTVRSQWLALIWSQNLFSVLKNKRAGTFPSSRKGVYVWIGPFDGRGCSGAQAATTVGPRLASKTAWKMVLSRVEEVSSGKLEGATGGRGH